MKLELRLIVTVDTHRAKKWITNDTRRGRELDYAKNFPFFGAQIKLKAQRRMSFMNSDVLLSLKSVFCIIGLG